MFALPSSSKVSPCTHPGRGCRPSALDPGLQLRHKLKASCTEMTLDPGTVSHQCEPLLGKPGRGDSVQGREVLLGQGPSPPSRQTVPAVGRAGAAGQVLLSLQDGGGSRWTGEWRGTCKSPVLSTRRCRARAGSSRVGGPPAGPRPRQHRPGLEGPQGLCLPPCSVL